MIPATAHFIWLTHRFPWLNLLSVKSAALRGGFERVVLHLAHELEVETERALRALPGVELRRIDPDGLLADPRLRERYGLLAAPAARSNVLRAAILEREGGVYLDMDTVTIRDLTPLRRDGAFFGLEHVAFPAALPGQSAAALRSRGLLLTALREGMRHAPEGWRHFRKVEALYPRAANNAVLGGSAGHPLLRELLARMASMPLHAARRRYALGTHLLQRVAAMAALGSPPLDKAGELRILEPAAFYPLGPRISRHWFLPCKRPDLGAVLSDQTRVVHWYASVLPNFAAVTPDVLRRNAGRQLFSSLLAEFSLLESVVSK